MNDPKIMSMMSVYGFEGYGKFWALVELLRRDDSYRVNITKKNFFNGIAHYLRSSIEDAKTFLNDCIYEFELFQTDGEYFWSNSLNERMGIMEERSNSKSEAAKIRWEKERKNKQLETTDNGVNSSESVNHEPKKEKPVRTKNATIAQCSEEVIQLTTWLIEKIKENNPNAKVNDVEKWKDSIRLLVETDNYSVEQVKKMIEFSQSDDFWKSNILSAKKLREKAGTLILQMGRTENEKRWGVHKRPIIEIAEDQNAKRTGYNDNHHTPEELERVRQRAREYEEQMRLRKMQG